MELVLRLVPEPSPERLRQALAAAAAHALSRGVTTVGDMGRLLGPKGYATIWSDLEEVGASGNMGGPERQRLTTSEEGEGRGGDEEGR